MPCYAIGIKGDCRRKSRAIAPVCIIKTGGPVFHREPPPCPIAKVLFKGPCAEVGVEIAMSVELPARGRKVDIDPRGWREGSPDVRAVGREGQFDIGDG